MASKSVAVITMSTRGTRAGPNVASFVRNIIEKPLAASNISVTDVDVLKFNLPVYNEKVVPIMVPEQASFEYEHSKAWSAEIIKYDGYVLVIPEYNYAMTGGTKNAIDYLLHEWKGKPVGIVSYGGSGGTNASEQVKDVLTNMSLKVVETRPQLAFAKPDLFSIIGTGNLGDSTIKAWEAEHTPSIQKLAEELKTLLLQPSA
ncbi:NADPH-dependent FMN reductase family protein [Daldinia bambusicola]|nr:NADPH-dependent FMN reductase family protein [Daldinia bambusicola]